MPSELPRLRCNQPTMARAGQPPDRRARALAAECRCRGHSRRWRRGFVGGEQSKNRSRRRLRGRRQTETSLGAIRAAAEPGREVLGCPWEQCSQYRRSVSNAKSPCESKTHTRSPVLRNVGPRVASAGRRYPAFRPAAASSSSPHEPRPISTSSHSLRGISPEVTSRIVANLTRSD